jgi:hypothetical protein
VQGTVLSATKISPKGQVQNLMLDRLGELSRGGSNILCLRTHTEA